MIFVCVCLCGLRLSQSLAEGGEKDPTKSLTTTTGGLKAGAARLVQDFKQVWKNRSSLRDSLSAFFLPTVCEWASLTTPSLLVIISRVSVCVKGCLRRKWKQGTME